MTDTEREERMNKLLTAEEQSDRGNFNRAAELCNEVLESTDKALEPAICARAFRLYCQTFWLRGEAKAAMPFAEEALTLAIQAGDRLEAAIATEHIGIIYWFLCDFHKALEYATAAYNEFVELGNLQMIARVNVELGNIYSDWSDYPRALEYHLAGVAGAEAIGQQLDALRAMSGVGIIYDKMSDYSRALEYYEKALAGYKELELKPEIARTLVNIGCVYSSLVDNTRALEYYTKGLEATEELGMKAETAIVLGNIGNIYHANKDYARALEYLGKALSLHKEIGNKSGIAFLYNSIGLLHHSMEDFPSALEYYSMALAVSKELGIKAEIALITGNIGVVYATEEFEGYDPVKAEEYLLKGITSDEELGIKWQLFQFYHSLSNLYEQEQRYAESLDYYKKYHELEKEVQSEEAKKDANLLEQRRHTEEREKELAIAKAAADAKHEATEQLLHNVLPPSIAHRMLDGATLIAEKLANVSVLFADIVNFTKLSQRITPEELVDGLDRIFSTFDNLAEKHGLEKIKTIGDAYMVVSGAPIQREDHAESMANFALEMVEAMKEFRSISTGEEIQLRVGIHTGEVVAGVIGKKKFAYDLWGDAVNTASRMESHGEAGKIHVTEEFMHAVSLSSPSSPKSLQFEERGEMAIKGKGTMKTYFLEKSI